MVRHERVILLLIAVAVAIPAVVKTRQNVPSAVSTGLCVSPPPGGVVHVGGDVVHPGMYPVSANMVTESVIKMAIPLHTLKNLAPTAVAAQHIKNGDDVRLTVGANGQGYVVVDLLPTPERMMMGIPLDINTMGVADFDRLPGIGPVIARRIVAYRQNNGGFVAVQELTNVEGIGARRYEILKKYF